MQYISYFDLLGTRGFCEDPEVYLEQMNKFYHSISELSSYMQTQGRIGVFSDCAYAETNDLQCLLDFLTELRDRLISENLFINAVIKIGEAGVSSVANTASEVFFGVKFTCSDIAQLYIDQSNFKGVGILVDDSISEQDINDAGYKTIQCFFMQKKTVNSETQWIPIEYKDIALNKSRYGEKGTANTLKILISTLYSSYIKAPRYGAYYISQLCNMIRSYCSDFKWCSSENKFEVEPVVFKSVYEMIDKYYEQLKYLPGLEFLALTMLDEIYNSNSLNIHEKKEITKRYCNLKCIQDKYMHSLNEVPDFIFSKGVARNNRNLFINLCQENLSYDFVDGIIVDDAL